MTKMDFKKNILLWSVQKHINDKITPFNMIEKHKQTPVNQPCTLLKQVQWRAICIRVNVLS